MKALRYWDGKACRDSSARRVAMFWECVRVGVTIELIMLGHCGLAIILGGCGPVIALGTWPDILGVMAFVLGVTMFVVLFATLSVACLVLGCHWLFEQFTRPLTKWQGKWPAAGDNWLDEPIG